MKITKQELIEMNACSDGLARFIEQTKGTEEAVEVVSLIGGKNTISDLLWLASKKLPKEKIVRFACDCALINLESIKQYTDKYELIEGFLRNPTDATTRAAARDAARAAARDAARDAADAARDAAVAAVDAAYAAVDAAAVAAYAAAYATEAVVNELLVKLFSEGDFHG